MLLALQQEKFSGDLEERVDEEFDRYQDRMAELMHDVNVDCFTVGWYQTVSFSDSKQKEIIESLVAYQELVDKAVVLCFDSQRHAEGRNAFKAFRVNPEFVPKFHSYEADVSQYSKTTADEILIEVSNPTTITTLYQPSSNGVVVEMADKGLEIFWAFAASPGQQGKL